MLQFGFGIAINESSCQICRLARSAPVRFETTIQRPVEAKGIGLHSGVPVSIRVLPTAPYLVQRRVMVSGDRLKQASSGFDSRPARAGVDGHRFRADRSR